MDQNAIAIESLLIKDWASGLRITTIPQAMRRLGFSNDIDQRWEMANHMDALWHSTLEAPEKIQEVNSAIGLTTAEDQAGLTEHWRDQVGSWDRASILLTDDEKLIARHILYRRRYRSSLPSLEEIAASVGTGLEETASGIRMLAKLGFLAIAAVHDVAGYSLTEDHGRFLDGLGFSFHTVTLDGDERFGIPWAIDFLLLVNSQYREHQIRLDDACAHCAERIQLEADHGTVTRVRPEEAVVHRGGTWGQNNLFQSEEHLREWNGGELPEPGSWTLASEGIESIRRTYS